MTANPVFREGMRIYFVEGRGFAPYFYVLVVLAPVEFLALFIPSLDAQMWTGSANLFKVAAITALLLIVYFALRVANLEYAPWQFAPLRHWLRERAMPVSSLGRAQLALLSVHVLGFVALCAPLLLWAGAIARTRPQIVFSTLLLIAFYAMSYGVWGLATAALWERRLESRQVFVRCLFFCLLVLSALLYLPLNPAAYLLSHLGGGELAPLAIAGRRWSAATVHFSFHGLLLAGGLGVFRWALKKEAEA